MNTTFRFVSLGLVLFLSSLAAQAQDIWSGNSVSFSKVAFSDPTDPANQDRLTPQTSLTRGSTRGLFNIQLEPSFSSLSPSNTEWAFDLAGNGNTGLAIVASNFAALTFEAWTPAVNNNPPGSVGIPGVVHLILEDIYVDIMFTSWGIGGGGGGSFAYVRGAPSASQSVRNSGSNPGSLSASNAVLGSSFTASVDLSTSGHALAILVLYTAQANIVLGGGQVMLVGGSLVTNMGMQTGPTANFSAMVPSNTALLGMPFSAQAVHWAGVRPFALSNAVDLVFGL